MVYDYILNLGNDSLSRFIGDFRILDITEKMWVDNNKYIKVFGYSIKYLKTTKQFREEYHDKKGITLIINILNKNEYMLTFIDSEMSIIKRFKQSKESINKLLNYEVDKSKLIFNS